ncbi:acyl carrier protein 1 isoform X1 [Wolffia australiana]
MSSIAAPSVFVASWHRSTRRKNQDSRAAQAFISVPGTQRAVRASSRRVSCSVAKPETVEKVSRIVKRQLALPDDAAVESSSNLAQLGADSLDTVEILMSLEEAFGISMDEGSAGRIVTVQDAADVIEKLASGRPS